jgi:hypothetical protein
VSSPAATRLGLAGRSGPERGGGGVRGRYVDGRPWAARSRPSARRWDRVAQSCRRRPRCGFCCRQEDCDCPCVVPERCRPCPGRRPEMVSAGVREAELRPLLRTLFLPLVSAALPGAAATSLFSPLGAVVRALPGNLWPKV